MPTVECSCERPLGVTISPSARTVPVVSVHISLPAKVGACANEYGRFVVPKLKPSR